MMRSPPPLLPACLPRAQEIEVQGERLKVLLLPRDPLDERSVMLEVGRGVPMVLQPSLFFHLRSGLCCARGGAVAALWPRCARGFAGRSLEHRLGNCVCMAHRARMALQFQT